nr:unnamed protein product [Spirometra erinaceieuropaei]
MSFNNDKLVHKLSSKELTEKQLQALQHEVSFNTADAKPVNMIAAAESILSQTGETDETKNLIRHQVSSLLMAPRPRDVLFKVEHNALKNVSADNELVIVPADKGLSTVVLDRTDYNQKAKCLLEDSQFYVPCEDSPIKTLTREINATLLAMENSGALSPIDRRPDSRDHLPTPTREIGRNGESSRTHPHHPAPEVLSQDILYVRWNDLGAGEGNANGFADFGIHRRSGPITVGVAGFPTPRPEFWAWYVDGTFVIIEWDQVPTFKEHLNAVFPNIQFTMEEEVNKQPAFLDVLFCRKVCDGLKNHSVLESDKYDTNTTLQPQPPDQSQTQLRRGAMLAR